MLQRRLGHQAAGPVQLLGLLAIRHCYERLRTFCLSIQPQARALMSWYGGCHRDKNGLQALFEEKHDLLSGHIGPQDPLHADLFK